MKNICKYCKKEYEYEPKRGSYKGLYCSYECKNKFNLEDNLPQKRICEECGKEYDWTPDLTYSNEGKVKVNTKKFCSYECGKKNIYNKVKTTTLIHHDGIGFADKEIRKKVNTTKEERYGDKNFLNHNQARQTCLEKYGAETFSKSSEFTERVRESWKNKSAEEISKIQDKTKATNLKKYGVAFISQSDVIKTKVKNTKQERYGDFKYNNREKAEITCLEKYGASTVTQVDEIKQKIKNTLAEKTDAEWEKIIDKRKKTNLKKYNTEFAQSTREVKNKIKETNLKRYNNTVAIQSDEIQQKIKTSNLKKYGTEFAIESDVVQDRIKQTNLKKYGYEYPFQSKEIRKEMEKHRKETSLKKYGCISPCQVLEFKEKAEATCLEKYGVPYNCMTSQCMNANRNTISKTNLKVQKALLDIGIKTTLEFHIEKQSYDLLCTDKNILIEINPWITHNSTFGFIKKVAPKEPYYHYNKTIKAKEYGYKCVCIWDWDDINKIFDLLINKNVFYGRNLKIKEVSKNETDAFLNQYHLQNTCKNQEIRLGLYTKNNELIQLMTFGRPRYNKNYEYELLRLCTKAGNVVVGGAERLFKYFIKKYNPNSIISYCDNSKFSGDVYKRLNMTLKTFGKPVKHWYNPKTHKHFTDSLLRERGYSQLHGDDLHTKGESNEKLMIEAGYVEIYDCGQSVYTWKKE